MAQSEIRVSDSNLEPHSIAETVHKIAMDLSRIIQGEFRLARSELSEKAKAVGSGAVALGVAAVAGVLAAACVVTACIAALTIVLPLWLSALITAVLLGFVAGPAYAVGRAKITHVDVVPERTVDTMKESIQWAKQRTE